MFDIQAEWVRSKCPNYERDNIVESVKEKLTNRSKAGIKKYGTTI